MSSPKHYDVLIIGAGAAGMMCAIEAGKRGRRVLLVDKAKKAGRKILISGGGKSNFTNLYVTPENYLSENPHFCKSALARYTQWDFMALMSKHGLTWEERKHGQLFCEERATAIVDMLLDECRQMHAEVRVHCEVADIRREQGFVVETNQGRFQADSLVIATGGPSIPKMGATDFAIHLAKRFSLKNLPFKPALVPFTLDQEFKLRYFKDLSGTAFDVRASCNGASFREQMLITHRGLSGPVILQVSSYWQHGDEVSIDLLPDHQAEQCLLEQQQQRPNITLKTVLGELLSKRFAQRLCEAHWGWLPLRQYTPAQLQEIGSFLNDWRIIPAGTEGMRTAEAATGGVDTDELSSKTLEAKKVAGLYFIGEAVDVTGHLGGFNFQWAWASGWCAGQYV